MVSKIVLCSDVESSSVTEFEFYLMQERTRFSLSHCLQHSVAMIRLGADPENSVTHGNPVFCSSNNTCKKKEKKNPKKPKTKTKSLFVSHVHNRRYGKTSEITLCLQNSSACIKIQIICHLP